MKIYRYKYDTFSEAFIIYDINNQGINREWEWCMYSMKYYSFRSI